MKNNPNQFVESIVAAILEEAANHEVPPRNVLLKVKESLDNKMRCVEMANPTNHNDMLDALMYAMRESLREPGHVNCRCSTAFQGLPIPVKILYSGNRTIVFWNDGSKTIVKCAEGQEYYQYSGFVAAFAKKMFGSTTRVKKVIGEIGSVQELKNKDETES